MLSRRSHTWHRNRLINVFHKCSLQEQQLLRDYSVARAASPPSMKEHENGRRRASRKTNSVGKNISKLDYTPPKKSFNINQLKSGYQGSASLLNRFRHFEKIANDCDPDSVNATNGKLPNPRVVYEAFTFLSSSESIKFAKMNDMQDASLVWVRKLLNLVEHQFRNNQAAEGDAWARSCVSSRNEPCSALAPVINMFLLPLKGTAFSLKKYGSRTHKREELSKKQILQALREAARVESLAREMMTEDSRLHNPTLFLAVLELWKSRCWYLGRYGRGRQSGTSQLFREAMGGVTTAEECIERMDAQLKLLDSSPNMPKLHQHAYLPYIGALAVSKIPGAADRARQILNLFEETQRHVDPTMYCGVMLAYANEVDVNREAVEGARGLWDHITSTKKSMQPYHAAATTLMKLFSTAQMPEQAEQLLLSYDQHKWQKGIKATRIDYNCVIDAWTKSGRPGAAKKGLKIFQTMIERAEATNDPNLAPDTISFSLLINVLARNPETGRVGLNHADQLLHLAENGDDPNVTADATMYLTYMSALAVRLTKQRKEHAKTDIASRMESLMRRMQIKSEKVPQSRATLWHNASGYAAAVSAWSRVRTNTALTHVLQLYRELKEERAKRNDNPAFKPGLKFYQDVLVTLGSAKASEKVEAVSLAEEIMDQIIRDGFPISITTINLYLRALSSGKKPAAVQEAHRRLQSLEEAYAAGHSQLVPDAYSYQVVMEAYAKTEGGFAQAEQLLRQLISISSFDETRVQNPSNFAACWNTVMDAWARSGREDTVENVARILLESQEHGVQPSSYSYAILINSLALHSDKVEDAPERAEALLAQMHSDFESGRNPFCRPTASVVASVLKCWSHCEREDAPDRMEAIVRRVKELSSHDGYQHLCLNYSSLKYAIFAWSKHASKRTDASDRATKLLDYVDEALRLGQIESGHAVHCYNATLLIIVDSGDVDKAKKAYSILNRMKAKVRTRGSDYIAVLCACKQTGSLPGVTRDQKQQAFAIAMGVFREYVAADMNPPEEVYIDMMTLHTMLFDDGQALPEEEAKRIHALLRNAPAHIRQSEKIQLALKESFPANAVEHLFPRLTEAR